MSKQREAFEAWAADNTFYAVARTGDGYVSTVLQLVWMAWQASRAAALEEAAITCRDMAQKQQTLGRQFAAVDCESAIRALKEQS